MPVDLLRLWSWGCLTCRENRQVTFNSEGFPMPGFLKFLNLNTTVCQASQSFRAKDAALGCDLPVLHAARLSCPYILVTC